MVWPTLRLVFFQPKLNNICYICKSFNTYIEDSYVVCYDCGGRVKVF